MRGNIRGFAIAWRAEGGFLLLRSEKKSKGLHYQLPGGHAEFPGDASRAAQFLQSEASSRAFFLSAPSSAEAAGEQRKKHVDEEEVARAACARELFEETGIDVGEDLGSLVPLAPAGVGPYNNRFFFFLHLTDKLLADAPRALQSDDAEKQTANGNTRALLYPENRDGHSPPLDVQLAVGLDEHTGFRFVDSAEEAAELVVKHAGGRSTKALKAFQKLLNKHAPLSPLETVRACTDTS
ncbi:putative NUDIX hydrolase domain-containing protein [Neospora caninum Liverpool]|nr:putative NUDIX hydrolase domain-containing protein [Neospora caninum Liverpool]CBZ51954.1 putative NUDIX hydrolase domain-containing protein [Neospora caninum Liverpool]|eukprot:XP_003881987.1 putative NUDIX hydrolase domain-containing protein [Neospora caninum Liverpool]